MSPHPFRAAVEQGDLDAAVALLAENVVFRSPAVFKPYEGRETVGTILRTISGVLEDGRIAEFTVMIRPASGLIAVAERMGPALEAAGVR